MINTKEGTIFILLIFSDVSIITLYNKYLLSLIFVLKYNILFLFILIFEIVSYPNNWKLKVFFSGFLSILVCCILVPYKELLEKFIKSLSFNIYFS